MYVLNITCYSFTLVPFLKLVIERAALIICTGKFYQHMFAAFRISIKHLSCCAVDFHFTILCYTGDNEISGDIEVKLSGK